MIKKSKPKKQHWVSRFYLKEFAIPETKNTKNQQVYIFSKHNGDPKTVNTKDIAAKRYLYSPLNKEGERCWNLEKKFQRIENLLARIWSNIANDFFDLEDEPIRKGLTLFISTLILRHPSNIELNKEIHKKLVHFYDSLPKDKNGCPFVGSIQTKDGNFDFNNSDWHDYKEWSENNHQHFFVNQIEKNIGYITKKLITKRWSVIFAKDPCFITTDKPVAIYHQTKKIFGISTKGTIVSFPLSPTRVLMLDDKDEEPKSQYYKLANDDPAPINLVHWKNAHNFMISQRHPDIVIAELIKYADEYETQ